MKCGDLDIFKLFYFLLTSAACSAEEWGVISPSRGRVRVVTYAAVSVSDEVIDKIIQTKFDRRRKICSGSRTSALPCLYRLMSSVPVFPCYWIHLRLILQAYNIHVNGVLHCRVRYSQLLSLHEQVSLQTLMELWSRNARVWCSKLFKCQDVHPEWPFFHFRIILSTRQPPDTQSQRIHAFSGFSSNSARICM